MHGFQTMCYTTVQPRLSRPHHLDYLAPLLSGLRTGIIAHMTSFNDLHMHVLVIAVDKKIVHITENQLFCQLKVLLQVSAPLIAGSSRPVHSSW